jgi:hypothetical protein
LNELHLCSPTDIGTYTLKECFNFNKRKKVKNKRNREGGREGERELERERGREAGIGRERES